MGDSVYINVEGCDFCSFYVHWRPKNLGQKLEEFRQWFVEHRGFDDPEYMMAQLIRNSTLWDDPEESARMATGYGLVSYEEGDFTVSFTEVSGELQDEGEDENEGD
jgi:hypothetical protein